MSKKLKTLRWLRILLFASGGLSVFMAVGMVAGFYYATNPDRLKNWIIEAAEKQTGGKLVIDSVAFELTHGFSLTGVKFTAPVAPLKDVQAQAKPIAIDEVRVHWNFSRLLSGHVAIEDVQLVKPVMTLVTQGSATNFDGIAAYRTRAFPAAAAPVPEPPAPPLRASKLIPEFLKNKDWGIAAEKIGFKDANITILNLAQKTTQRVDADLRLDLEASVTQLLETLEIKVHRMETPQWTLRDQFLTLKSATSWDRALSDIRTEIFVAATRGIDLRAKATVKNLDDRFEELKWSTETDGRMDLTLLDPILSTLAPLHVAGKILVQNLRTEGQVNLHEMQRLMTAGHLPSVQGAIVVEKVGAKSDVFGFAVSDLDLKVTGRTENSGESFAIVENELKLGGASYRNADIQAQIKDFTWKAQFEADVPNMRHADAFVQGTMGSIQAVGKAFARLQTSMSFDVKGQMRESLRDNRVEMNFDVKNIIRGQVLATCTEQCAKASAEARIKVQSLEAVRSLALSAKPELAHDQHFPTLVGGRLTLDTNVQALLDRGPELLAGTANLDTVMHTAQANYGAKLDVADVRANMEAPSLHLKGGHIALQVAGDLKNVKLQFRQQWKSIEMQDANGKVTGVNDFAVHLEAQHKTPSLLDVKGGLPKSVTYADFETTIAEMRLPQLAGKPLKKFHLGSHVEQAKGAEVKATADTVVPDLGFHAHVESTATLDEKFAPQSASAALETYIKKSREDLADAYFKGAGEVALQTKLVSPDMNNFTLEGKAKLDHFSLELPGEPSQQVKVTDINGEFPFQYAGVISKLKELSKNSSPSVTKAPEKKEAPSTDPALDDQVDKFLASRESPARKFGITMENLDYGANHTYYPGRQPLTFAEVNVQRLHLRNGRFDLNLKPTGISLSDFQVEFLGGEIQGDILVLMTPLPASLRVNVHATRLDTRKLLEEFENLKDKTTGWNVFSDPYLDATVHLNYDMIANDLAGGVDVTRIGQEQLKMILFYVDPEGDNPTIAQIRKALSVGSVRNVSVPIRNGMLGLDLDVRLLNAHIPTPKLQNVPIAQILNNLLHSSAPPSTSNSEGGKI